LSLLQIFATVSSSELPDNEDSKKKEEENESD
jgi:hypothetical protein